MDLIGTTSLPDERKPSSETNDAATAEDLQPHFVEQMANKAGLSYDNIESVSTTTIQEGALELIRRNGATDWDELIKLVARDFGFSRTGSKIRRRLESVLHDMVRSGVLRRSGNRVTAHAADPL